MKLHVFKSLGERTNENESICYPKSALYAERSSSADINPKSYHLTAFELINPLLCINFLSFECKILHCRRLLRFDFVPLLFPVVLNGSPFEIPPILQSRTVQVVNIRCHKISESYKVMSIINDFSLHKIVQITGSTFLRVSATERSYTQNIFKVQHISFQAILSRKSMKKFAVTDEKIFHV